MVHQCRATSPTEQRIPHLFAALLQGCELVFGHHEAMRRIWLGPFGETQGHPWTLQAPWRWKTMIEKDKQVVPPSVLDQFIAHNPY